MVILKKAAPDPKRTSAFPRTHDTFATRGRINVTNDVRGDPQSQDGIGIKEVIEDLTTLVLNLTIHGRH